MRHRLFKCRPNSVYMMKMKEKVEGMSMKGFSINDLTNFHLLGGGEMNNWSDRYL